jgi:hypothetical protein
MSWRHILAALALLAPGAATAAEIDDFFGEWRGVELSIDGPEKPPDLTPADLDMSIADQGGGFRVRAVALAREPDGRLAPRRFDAAFAPTGTPGVFAFEPGGGCCSPACSPTRPTAIRWRATRCSGRAWRTTRCTSTAWRSTTAAASCWSIRPVN